VDEFWALPSSFLKHKISQKGYITANWIKGFPVPDIPASDLPKMYPLISRIIKKLKQRLPEDTKFIIPWEYRYDEVDHRYYGVKIPNNPKSNNDFVTHLIPFSKQILEPLQPTHKGKKIFRKMAKPSQKIITIFPRCCLYRRPDKNWIKEKYESLIQMLQTEFPQYKIAVCGEPGGTFFADEGVPEGCLDLIRVNPIYRTDVQLAALSQAILSIGSQSGGMAFSLAAGCPSLTWGGAVAEKGFKAQNYLKTKLIFYPDSNPSANLVFKYAKWMIGMGKRPYRYEIKRIMLLNFINALPRTIRESRVSSLLKKSFRVSF